MKGIRFAILRTGVALTDPHSAERGVWYYCVLVQHPTEGYFMYDVGVGPGDDTFRRPENHIQQCPLGITRDEYVDKALGKLGLSVNDISSIVISHCHWDHFGGLTFFRGTKAMQKVYVNEEDFKYGLVQSHRTAKGYVEPCDFYYKWNFDVEGAEFQLLQGDTELFPGVEFKVFQGHTVGCMAMILHAENNTYIFPGDTIPTSGNYNDPENDIHFTTVDIPAFRRSVEEIKALQKKYNAKILFPHDEGPVAGYVPTWQS